MLVTRRPVLITADVQTVPSQGAHGVGTQRSKPTWVLAHSRGIGECIRIELGEPAATKACRHTHLRDARPSAGQMKIEHRCLEPKGDIRVTAGRTLEKVRRNLSSLPSCCARPRGKKRRRGGLGNDLGAYAALDSGNEVGFPLVPRARSVVGPETLRAPRIVATGCKAPEHD